MPQNGLLYHVKTQSELGPFYFCCLKTANSWSDALKPDTKQAD